MMICLIRHGETEYNREDRMQGRREIALSERGRQEARALGDLLRHQGVAPDRLFSSPLRRAVETATGLGFACPLIPCEAFQARRLGDLEGLTKPEIRTAFPGAVEKLIEWDYYPPGGDESLGDLFRRADRMISQLVQEFCEPLFVVTHSGVLEALARGWLRVEAPHPLPFPIRNAGAMFFHGAPGRWLYDRGVAAGTSDSTDLA